MSYFLSFGKQAEPRLSGFADADWLNAVDLDLDNIRLALTTSERAGSDPDAGLAIITAVHRYFYVRGYLTEGRKLMDRALERSTGKADKLHAQALNARGVLAWRQGDFKQAESDYRASLEIWRVLGPEYRSTVANTLNNLGTLLGDRGEAAESRACHEEASAIFGELDDQVGAARLWLNWGAQEIERGNRPLARSLLGRAAPIFRAQSDWLREAIVESNLGQIDDFEGNRVEAVEHFRQSYVKFNEQDRLGTRITLARISACAHRAGRPEESAQLLLLAWPDDEDGRGVLARTVPEAAALWDQLNKSLGSDPIKPLSVETKSRRSTLEIIDGLLGSLGALERQPV
jgi:tetratricopeptide (TPR) repeat protein